MKFAQFHILFLLLLGGLCLGSCSEKVPDETRIRQRIDAMSTATGKKDLSAVLEPVHESFLGNEHIRKINLRGLLVLHFQRHKNVHVFVNDVEVVLRGGTAEVTCNVLLAGRSSMLPEEGRVLRVTSQWQKIDDDWLVVSASWRDPLLMNQ